MQLYKMSVHVVLCTRNRKKILNNPEVFDIISNSIRVICDRNGAVLRSIKTGVISPDEGLLYTECALRFIIDIIGTTPPEKIIIEFKNDVREKIKGRFPGKPNPFTKDFLITDEKKYDENIAYEFINSSTWRTGDGNARRQKLLSYIESIDKLPG